MSPVVMRETGKQARYHPALAGLLGASQTEEHGDQRTTQEPDPGEVLHEEERHGEQSRRVRPAP